MLPKDKNILLSVINCKLRDCGKNLSSLCDDLNECVEEIKKSLSEIGYFYNSELNQFVKE